MACGAVQKPTDARWQEEADAIYATYSVYHQSGGVEQAVFDAGTGSSRRRSQVLLDRLRAAVELPGTADALDVGCGNGAMLTACAETQPEWSLFGHDLSAINLDTLSRIPSFQKLYKGPLSDLPKRFDLITMLHSLEHFTDPVGGLADLRPKLKDGGTLFIQVPNVEATPFDLLIADHVSHFSRHDIARVLERTGFDAVVLADDWVTKELSAVARARTGGSAVLPPPTAPEDVLRRVHGQITWLQTLISDAQRATAENRPFGLFGSSISAIWLFGQVGEAVSFFVDEDPSRLDTTLFGRPVLHPSAVPSDAVVMLGLIPPVAAAVAARLDRPGVDWRLPPRIRASGRQ